MTISESITPVVLTDNIENKDLNLTKLAEMAADPFMANKIETLQTQCCDALAKVIDEVAGMLEQDNKPLSSKMPTTAVALASAARQREMAGKQRRELAQEFVMGALLNYDNPNWDPVNPETHQQAQQNSLLAVLMMNPAK